MNKLHDISLDGIGNINGGDYKDIKISGVGTILNNITCENITLEGVSKVNGNINCNNISIEGTFNSNGSIEANDKITISGYLKLDENIQGSEVNIDGKVGVKGLLSGDKINILFVGKSKVKEIGGEEITALSVKKSFISETLLPNKLVSDSIEGDIVILENTECDIVRGKKVTIKSGCKIKKIEYTDEIYVDAKSNVENVIKL